MPLDRTSFDSIIQWVMREGDGHYVIAGSYRLCDLIGDLAGTAIVEPENALKTKI